MQGELKVQTPIVINIDDMSHKVLKAFVRFFYTAAIDPEIMEKHSTSLYCAAEKYGVKLLKKLCEEWIMNNMSDQNALSNLELAKQYDSEVVKDAVFHAASLHIDKIPSYAEYQTYVEKDPGLLVELYEGTVKMMSRKRSRKGKLNYSEILSYCGPKPLFSSLQLPTDWRSLADMVGDYQASTPSRLSEDCDSTGNDAHSAA